MFKRLFFGLVAALLFSASAHASFPATQSARYSCGGQPGHGGWHATTTAAVAAWVASYNPGAVGPPYGWSGGNCTAILQWNGATANTLAYSQPVLSCPANATLSGTLCTCNSGYTENGSSCINSQCQVGKAYTFNRTEGWGRSPDADANDLVVDHGPPGFYGYSDGVCVGDIARVERCWRSQEPSAQGLYRTSCDYTMLISGEASPGTGDTAAAPTTPVPPCPGVLGEFNGKPLCVGTASNPLPPSQDAPNQPTGAGNPSAGVKPSTGPGSGSDGAGRTPATGNGGNNGGPAGAAVGRGGTGSRGEPGQDGTAVCGAPPLPSCNVKVDETGTPAEGTAAGRFGQANTDVDATQSDAEGFIRGLEDIVLPSWSWTFAFPTGCIPLVLPAFNNLEIDVCQWQPIIHDLMSVIWVIAGIWGFIGLFRNATGV
jgi:hypothetical protein